MRLARSRLLLSLLVGCVAPIGVAAPPGLIAQALHDAPVRYEDDYPSAEFHRSRREAVMDRLPGNAVAVLFAAPTRNRSNDVDHEYRQSSDFLYLTGSHESGSALILAPGGVHLDGRIVREVLFVPPRDPAEEVWLGRRFGAERAMEVLGVELALEATRFEEIAGPLLTDRGREVFHLPLADGVASGTTLADQHALFLDRVDPVAMPGGQLGFVLHAVAGARTEEAWGRVRAWTSGGFDASVVPDPKLRELAQAFTRAGSFEEWSRRRGEILAGRPDGSTLRTVLDELRVVKTDEELRLLGRAIDITAEAHRAVMEQVEAGWAEYEIEALVEYTFKARGAEHPSFPSIVGSGENSVILHYETNRRTTESGDVVVIDIGAEVHGYTADVTRTVPVDGRFTEEQRAIYDVVHRAQRAGIDAARVGAPVAATHQAASAVLAQGLAELGLISGPRDGRGLRRFFMHGTSHYLGLDVHDVGTGEPMRPGTVITVEPGIYVAPAEDVDPKWWNIGVRIEDDVLITEDGPVVLSDAAPASAAGVELLMRGASPGGGR